MLQILLSRPVILVLGAACFGLLQAKFGPAAALAAIIAAACVLHWRLPAMAGAASPPEAPGTPPLAPATPENPAAPDAAQSADLPSEEIRAALHAMADQVEHAVRGPLDDVSVSTTKLRELADDVARAAETSGETMVNSGMAADAALESTQRLAEIAGQMEATVSRIAARREEASRAAEAAVAAGDLARTAMAELSRRLDSVIVAVGRISGIARQTNLLALNATIEAVRAGDAGAGFAVVAGEVKSLARETAALTQEVSTIIADTRSVSSEAANRMDDMQARISFIEATAAQIGNAVDEHRDATSQISQNVHQSLDAAHTLSTLVSDLTAGMMAEMDRSAQVHLSTSEIAEHVATLCRNLETTLVAALRSDTGANRRAGKRYEIPPARRAALPSSLEAGGKTTPAVLLDIADGSCSMLVPEDPGLDEIIVHIATEVQPGRIMVRRPAEGGLRLGIVFTAGQVDAAALAGEAPSGTALAA